MTQEQYNRAVEIGERLEDLKRVLSEIDNEVFLTYNYREGGAVFPCSQIAMFEIRDILDRHDKMIREEIDNEIEKHSKWNMLAVNGDPYRFPNKEAVEYMVKCLEEAGV